MREPPPPGEVDSPCLMPAARPLVAAGEGVSPPLTSWQDPFGATLVRPIPSTGRGHAFRIRTIQTHHSALLPGHLQPWPLHLSAMS